LTPLRKPTGHEEEAEPTLKLVVVVEAEVTGAAW